MVSTRSITRRARTLKQPLLLSLAPELIQIIIDYLDILDVEHLRLTCKTLGALLRPHVFRVLRFKVTKDNLLKDLSRLCFLAGAASMVKAPAAGKAEAVHPASYGVRTLYIGPLAPSYDLSCDKSLLEYVDSDSERFYVPKDSDDDTPYVALGEAALRVYLFDALASLKNVSRVEWTPTRVESVETQRTVMEALKTLPNLRSVRFCLGQCKIGLPLDTLTSLREISLSGTCETDHDVTLASLARLVSATPSLTAIDIATNWVNNRPIARSQSLHALFEHYPRGAAPLRLRRLALKAALVRLDQVTLPHLQYLTALSLTNIEDPYTRGLYVIEDFQNSESGGGAQTTLMEDQKRYGSNLEQVWRALKGAEIWLEELTVDVVVPTLMEYLKAYSGLKKLDITPKNFEEGTRADEVADQFYTAVLGKHALSLQELEVDPLYEGKWCIGPHNLAVIASCQQLKILKMCVVGNHVNAYGDFIIGTDFIKTLLDEAALSMSQLDDIQIDATNCKELRDSKYWNVSTFHFSSIRRLLSESVISYMAPLLAHRLPASVTVGRFQDVKEFVAKGVGCGYVCITSKYE